MSTQSERYTRKPRPKIPFTRWVQFGANGNHVKRIYKQNISYAGQFDEAGFFDELEDFLSGDNVAWEYDYLFEWCKKYLFNADVDNAIF